MIDQERDLATIMYGVGVAERLGLRGQLDQDVLDYVAKNEQRIEMLDSLMTTLPEHIALASLLG